MNSNRRRNRSGTGLRSLSVTRAAATMAEREELSRLRRENRHLRLEREILSKAAAWFAQETNAIPPKGSGSRAITRPIIQSPRCAECWVSPPAAIMRG
jgi:transposase-like protein